LCTYSSSRVWKYCCSLLAQLVLDSTSAN
jgi:hypothetical protein